MRKASKPRTTVEEYTAEADITQPTRIQADIDKHAKFQATLFSHVLCAAVAVRQEPGASR